MNSRGNLTVKRNILATTMAKRSISPNLTVRNERLGEGELQSQEGSKLYTFCSSDNKGLSQEENDENYPTLNLTSRERKVSLNNLKGKVYEPVLKHNPKSTVDNFQVKDRKKCANMSVTCIQTLNGAFEKRKQGSQIGKTQDKKVNISINLNPRVLRELEEHNRTDFVLARQLNPVGQKDRTLGKRGCESRQLGKTFCEGGKQKIVVEEEQLSKFTKICANQRYLGQQRIRVLESQLLEYAEGEKEWRVKQEQYLQYIDQSETERQRLESEMTELQSTLRVVRHDNQYYILAKDEARRAMREQQGEIDHLRAEVEALREDKVGSRGSDSIRKLQTREVADTIKLLQIQNIHLKQQVSLNRGSELKMKHSCHSLRDNSDERVHHLLEQNKRLREQLKVCSMGQIEIDICQKTIQDFIVKMTVLEEENQVLRNKFRFDCRSAGKESQLCEFQFKLDSHPQQRSATSPSQVECIWKREPTDLTNSFRVDSLMGGSGCEWVRQ